MWGMLQCFLGQSLRKSKAPLGRFCFWTPWFGLSYPSGPYSETPTHRFKLGTECLGWESPSWEPSLQTPC